MSDEAWSFAAGPARLPDTVLARASAELFSRGPEGAAAIEKPFADRTFRALAAGIRDRLASLLGLPENYRVLLLAGGAMQQFGLVPLNLCRDGERSAYAVSGYWSARAFDEASKWADALMVAGRSDGDTRSVPSLAAADLPDDCAYCHVTPNETVDGIAWPTLPLLGTIPLVADCTSCFLTAPLDVTRFGLIYASAQKNIGTAGLVVIIVREDLLGRGGRRLPSAFDYTEHARKDHFVYTPPMFAMHVTAMVLEWIVEQGGLAAMGAANAKKAELLYGVIDASDGFYESPVLVPCRSPVNVRFHLRDAALTEGFLSGANERGLHHLAGHSSVGGMRASLYNAMPERGVRALVDYMRDFSIRWG